MKKKYTSMQEELAARRGDQTHKGSNVFEKHEGFRETFRARMTEQDPSNRRALIVVTVAIIAFFFILIPVALLLEQGPAKNWRGQTEPAESTQATYGTEATESTEATEATEVTETTQTTETAKATEATDTTRPTTEQKGDFSEDSLITDVEAYVEENTEPCANENVLYGDPFYRIDKAVNKGERGCNWYIHNGRIYVNPEVKGRVKMDKLVERWTSVDKEIHKGLKEEKAPETPVVIAVRDRSYDLLLLLIDGKIVFQH